MTTATRLLRTLLLCSAVVSLSAPQARATCMTNCEATLVGEGCEPMGDEGWPPWLVLQATISCETCCSAPGGPSECSPEEVDIGLLQITQDGAPVGGSWVTLAAGDVCPDEAIFQHWPHLDPGDYELTTSQGGFGLILAQFTVYKPPCTTDDQCMACEACMEDGCTWTGIPSCTIDADCPEGQLCYVNDDEPCNNGCGDPPPPPCETDADCGPCDFCQADGTCITPPGLPPECGVDADCEDGMFCVSDGCTAYCDGPVEESDAETPAGSDAGSSTGEPDAPATGPEPDSVDDAPGDDPVEEPDAETPAPSDTGSGTDDTDEPGSELEPDSVTDAPGDDPASVADTTLQRSGGPSGGGGCTPAPGGPVLPHGLLLVAMMGLAILRRTA